MGNGCGWMQEDGKVTYLSFSFIGSGYYVDAHMPQCKLGKGKVIDV